MKNQIVHPNGVVTTRKESELNRVDGAGKIEQYREKMRQFKAKQSQATKAQ